MSYTVFIYPVSHVSKETLYTEFSKFGEIKDVFIPRDDKTGIYRNFAFVKYSSKYAQEEAIKTMNGKDLNGKILQIRGAEDRKQDSDYEAAKQKEIERKRNIEKENAEKYQFYDRYYSAVDYPKGIGEEYTPMWSRGIPPVGLRKTFFTWSYIPIERVRKILEEEAFRTRSNNKY